MRTVPGVPYLPGFPPTGAEPLGRYLPPLAHGVIKTWLEANLPLSDREDVWVLDPFTTTPLIAVEAARSGYRVLVAANNPISRFLVTMAAHPPSEGELRAALADIATARKGDERLEPHILSLYTTLCNQCGSEISAEAFLWDRGSWGLSTEVTTEKSTPNRPTLFAKIIRCPYCGANGEFPALDSDLERAAQFQFGGLHYARALERVVSLDDPDRHYAEEALATYLPRAVYALFTLINKLHGLPLAPSRRDALTALLLSACDQANTLWPYPTGRARPRLLTIPPRFRENNIWLALEQAVDQWLSTHPPVPVTIWPQVSSERGSICLYIGRLRDLVKELSSVPLGAIITALPRPNQAFWTLSALWAGWLWGREAAAPFKSVLRRRRYDWVWHTMALHAALSSLTGYLKSETPCFGLVGEAEPGFLSATMIASDYANFALTGLALHEESAQAQIFWRYQPIAKNERSFSKENQISLIRSAARDYLKERGEPARYLNLHVSALASLAHNRLISTLSTSPAEALGLVNEMLNETFTYRHGFVRYGGSEKSLEVGLWWLRETEEVALPLADRVENELVRYLLKNPGVSQHQIDVAMCQAFPGLLTPNASLIQVILASYAEQFPPNSGLWRIQEQNLPEVRRNDVNEVLHHLETIARNLGYTPQGEIPLLWRAEDGSVQYAWYVIASGVIGEIIHRREFPPQKSLIVLPGSRANLVAYKLHHDPRLRQALEEGWRLIKFRQIRWLAQKPRLKRDELDHLLAQDTLTYDAPQMRLF